MKLAFCLFKYFPYGGLQRDFLRIAKAAHARGHEIHVYTMQWEGEQEPAFNVHVIAAKRWQNHTSCRHFAETVKIELAKHSFDLVIGFNKMPYLDVYYAADVCYKARMQEQGAWYDRSLPRYRQQAAFEKAVFARGEPCKILLLSPLQQPIFMQHYQTEAQRFFLLPPGISRDRAPSQQALTIRQTIRAGLHIHADQLLLLMVGSGFKTKGVDRTIKALAALPDAVRERCQLIVIGRDRPQPFLQLARRLKVQDKIRFLGARQDVPDFLLAADFLLHPSYHENTGTVILEALVAGLPVLTLTSCGYAHYVHEARAGIVLLSPFLQLEFNNALLEMILSPQRKNWQSNALTFAQNADIYHLPERAMDIIEKQTAHFRFERMMALQGDCVRKQPGRLTQRVALADKYYFIKQHSGVGWKEICKNLLQLRLPVLGAKNEWLALEKLRALKVPVPDVIAFGERGKNPARIQSYVLLEELTEVMSLEDLYRVWQHSPPTFNFKQALITEVARIARLLHQHGMNHRDFYSCHFLLDISAGLPAFTPEQVKIYLIDLHRAQIRNHTPERWIIKDLAGLYFSCKDARLTTRDMYRFMQHYQEKPLRDVIKQEKIFWQKVKSRGEKLYRDHAK